MLYVFKLCQNIADETVAGSQFGHLQLDYSSSSADSSIRGGSASRTAPTVGISNTGGWSQPQVTKTHNLSYNKPLEEAKDNTPYIAASNTAFSLKFGLEDEASSPDAVEGVVIPGVRSPPDGQIDEQSSAAAHHLHYYCTNNSTQGMLDSKDAYSSYLPSAGHVANHFQQASAVPGYMSHPSSFNNPASNSSLSSTTTSLWPRFSSNSFPSHNNECQGSNVSSIINTNDGPETKRKEAIGASPTDQVSRSDSDFSSELLPVNPPIALEPSINHSVEGNTLSVGTVSEAENNHPDLTLAADAYENVGVLDNVDPRHVDVLSSIMNSNHRNSPRPLDIVTGACKPNFQEADGLEACRPDVIGVSHNDGSMATNPVPGDQVAVVSREDERASPLVDGNDPIPGDNPPLLLPDIMTDNGGDTSAAGGNEWAEPAIVMENTLSFLTNNEPALVQESQTNNRIPELVNIHQTYESAADYQNNPTNNRTEQCDVVGTSYSQAGRLSDGFNQVDLVNNSTPVYLPVVPMENCDRVSSLTTNSDIPDVDRNYSNPASNDSGDHPEQVINLIFNPHADIPNIDLEAELAELEEEQAALQGAYAVAQDSTSGDEMLPLNAELSFHQDSLSVTATNDVDLTGEMNDDKPSALPLGPDIIEEATALPNLAIAASVPADAAAMSSSFDSEETRPRHDLTSQMSREFDSEGGCGRVDSLPSISAEVCAESPPGDCDATDTHDCDSGVPDAAPDGEDGEEPLPVEQELEQNAAENFIAGEYYYVFLRK